MLRSRSFKHLRNYLIMRVERNSLLVAIIHSIDQLPASIKQTEYKKRNI